MSYAQSNPLDFFPHHEGDIWEYQDPQNGNIEQNKITADSLGLDGRYYTQTTLFGELAIDTVAHRVYGNTWGGKLYSNLLYDLNADSGDTWTVSRSEFRILKAVVVKVQQGFVFGNNPSTIKVIDYVDSVTGLLFTTDYLASEFGLIQQDFDATPIRIIRGTRINGVQHGLITDEVPHDDDGLIPHHFTLDQNYPNPFNGKTIIRYKLQRESFVRLEVFNLQGEILRRMVNSRQESGTYQVPFDADGLASGVYVYRIVTAAAVQQGKMLLIK